MERMNETRNDRRGLLARACVLGVLCGAVLSGCATTYRICLPQAPQCSEVTSYRKIAELSLIVTPDGGVTVEMSDVDRQTAGPLEQAAADMIRAMQVVR